MEFVTSHNINIPSISIGKKQLYEKKTFYPIYYNYDSNIKYQPFNYKTNRLFISNKFKQSKWKSVIELTKIENIQDIIRNIESRITKLLKNRKTNQLQEKDFVSLIKNNNQLYLSVYSNTVKCLDIYQKEIYNLDFLTPTYGYFFLEFKNVWETDFKWGINIAVNGCMILPSQLISPPFSIKKIKIIFTDEALECQSLLKNENNPKYQTYFKMKKMGIPIQAIKNKMIIDKLDPNIIDTASSTQSENNNKIKNKNPFDNCSDVSLGKVSLFNSSLLNYKPLKSIDQIDRTSKSKLQNTNNYPKITVDDIKTILGSLKKLK